MPPAPPLAAWRSVLWPCTVIGVLVVLTVGLELLVTAADLGLIGSTRWRSLVLQYGACWPGLVRGWQPNYAWQPWTMFLSYSVLHAGILHLAGNILMLLWIGPGLVGRIGQRGFLLVWVCSALGGAMVFVALASDSTPMVGASGSVFGLIGAVVMFDYVQTGRYRAAIGITLALVLLNLVMLVAENGLLAWQTHLGGYIAGALVATLLTPKRTTTTNTG
jgi:membrane associated rhomboid family serine protease